MVMRAGLMLPLVLLVLICLGTFTGACRGDVPPEEGRDRQQTAEQEREEKEQLTRVGVVLFWLVVALSVLMMAAVLVWGLRTRRITGGKLPEVTANDPLWYLQPGEERAALTPSENESKPSPPTESHDRTN